MLSMNIAKTAESIMEVKNTGTILKFTILAIDTHSHLKKPVRAMNSTISIKDYSRPVYSGRIFCRGRI